MKYFLVIVYSLCLWRCVFARCKMRGECYELNEVWMQCPNDIEPPPLIDDTDPEEFEEIIQILRHRCPTLTVDENGNDLPAAEILTCCDAIQIRKMSESMLMSDGVLGRCPICARNFARQICEMNCSPDQARFIDVYEGIGSNGTRYVNEVDYRVHADFMEGAFASCANVIIPQTGTPAVNLMCGNAAVCDDEAWFSFTGDTSINPLAPVQVNFLKWYTEDDSMNARAPPCNETLEGDLPCSCLDCPVTCPVGNEPTVPEQCTVLSINCISFSVGLTFFVVSIIVFIVLTVLQHKRNFKDRPTEVVNNLFVRSFESSFAKIGAISASNPILMLMFTTWLVFIMFFGFMQINLTSNPIALWSAPASRSRHELEYFNSRFGPFYRAAQVFLKINLDSFEVDNTTYGPAFRFEAVSELIALENAIIDIGRNDSESVRLEQVCYAPLRYPGSEPDLDLCVSMSVSSYFVSDRYNINNDTYLETIRNCLNNHYALNCLASWGGGADPLLTFGGYEGDDILGADTLLINFPITNYLLEADLEPVLEWEGRFIELLHDYEANWKADFVEVSFACERSIEDEITRVSVAEAVPITISYILMFIYVTFSLGNARSCSNWLVESKVMVAVGSILVVVAAIFCAMGVMGYANITLTLLAINVIPFFVLSIGIDNVFLMMNTLHDINSNLKQFDDYNEHLSFDKKRVFVFSKMMGRVGPSMFVSSVTQVTCFAIGSLANFPAVVTFSIFASISLAFLFIFQITTVVALISLDYKRASQKRLDIFCCIQKKVLDDTDPLHSETPYESITSRLMGPFADFLLRWQVKITVVIVFITITAISVMLIPQLEIGLDQEMALPVDSYVYRYLQSVNNAMRIGPPVFFVLTSGLNFSNIAHQNAICGGRMCNSNSLTTQIFLAAQHSDVTYIATSSNSWLDDFIDWASLSGSCCQYNTTDGSFCPSMSAALECESCVIERDDYADGLRPAGEAFELYVPFFLRDTPTEFCNRGGLASYYSYVNYELNSNGRAIVGDTSFMAFHVSLATSQEYITAVKYGYEVADNITAAIRQATGTDVEVFPYSVFYVYYEQYLTMWSDTFSSLGYCLIGALVFNLLASGFNFLTTFAVMFTAVMVVLNMMGVMYLWNIPLNAVSCVNLVVSIGIAVEFCTHIAYASATTKDTPDGKVKAALRRVGSTIITGITLTNIPIIVLAFSYTEIIEVFFFRMFFSLVILGFLHGMIFFPVFMSYLYNL